jgi:hypothetical protein
MAGISPNFFPPPDSSGEMPAEEARPPKALFTTVIFVLKYASKPEVVTMYAF